MKILAVSIRVPEQGKKGDQVLSFYRLSYLARHHDIHLICFGSLVKDSIALERLESIGISVHLVKWNWFVGFFNVVTALFFSEVPFQCALYRSNSYRDKVLHSIEGFKPDAFYAVMIRSVVNLTGIDLPLFVDLVDSMGLNFSRRAAMEHGLKRLFFNLECQRVSAYEVWVAQAASRSFIVSDVDKQFIGHENIETLPLGIDGYEFFRHTDCAADPIIVFTGNMNYRPNVEAVLWFHKFCWSNLKVAMPKVHWLIAGSSPSADILALSSDKSITVTGRVPSLAAVINSAQVSIAPMQSGSGMQFKILEAMACGVPVVTTPLGLGDIGAEATREVLLADTAEEFVQAVFSLLRTPELRKKIGDAGLRYVRAHHTWDALNARFERATFATLNN